MHQCQLWWNVSSSLGPLDKGMLQSVQEMLLGYIRVLSTLRRDIYLEETWWLHSATADNRDSWTFLIEHSDNITLSFHFCMLQNSSVDRLYYIVNGTMILDTHPRLLLAYCYLKCRQVSAYINNIATLRHKTEGQLLEPITMEPTWVKNLHWPSARRMLP